jgi:hypothetical protein
MLEFQIFAVGMFRGKKDQYVQKTLTYPNLINNLLAFLISYYLTNQLKISPNILYSFPIIILSNQRNFLKSLAVVFGNVAAGNIAVLMIRIEDSI